MGMDHLNKAKGFQRERNWPQALRQSDLAATKLKQLKDRPLEAISEALELKCIALGDLGRHREQLECATEWYCLWNTTPTDVGAIDAAFFLIQSCMTNKEYEDAHLYASTLYEIINHKHDNKIPEDQRQYYIARGAYCLAKADVRLAKTGGIPPEKMQKTGQEAIALARKALEMHTQLYGTECSATANDMSVLAEALDYFNDAADDEALRLFQQSLSINTRVFGSTSVNVATVEDKLGDAYTRRAIKSHHVPDRCASMLELSLPHYREAARIFRAVGRVAEVDRVARNIVTAEDLMRKITTTIAANDGAAAAATKG